MKTLMALCVLVGAISPAGAQLPSPQDLKKLTELRPAPTGQKPSVAPPGAQAGMMPECEKTQTLLGLCPKGTRPYGSEPRAIEPAAPTGYPSGPNGIRPGETTAQCEARVAATGVGIRKGGCRRTESRAVY